MWCQPGPKSIQFFLNVPEFSLEMDESYHLNITLGYTGKINATIIGSTFFGVRHGLETLSQLFIYDDRGKHPLVRFFVKATTFLKQHQNKN